MDVSAAARAAARAALARMKAREGEDVQEWDERLAADSAKAGEAEYHAPDTALPADIAAAIEHLTDAAADYGAGESSGASIEPARAALDAAILAILARLARAERLEALHRLLSDAQPTVARHGDEIVLHCPDGTITDDLYDALEAASHGLAPAEGVSSG